jgi:hypothetical protein
MKYPLVSIVEVRGEKWSLDFLKKMGYHLVRG